MDVFLLSKSLFCDFLSCMCLQQIFGDLVCSLSTFISFTVAVRNPTFNPTSSSGLVLFLLLSCSLERRSSGDVLEEETPTETPQVIIQNQNLKP